MVRDNTGQLSGSTLRSYLRAFPGFGAERGGNSSIRYGIPRYAPSGLFKTDMTR